MKIPSLFVELLLFRSKSQICLYRQSTISVIGSIQYEILKICV